jgi:imidazoleglycerol phosphate synthase glutamine amidotransferase subunit HisH
MKKLATILLMGLAIGMTFMSCSKEEVNNEDCGVCFETIEQKVLETCWRPNGLPYLCWNTYRISLTEVECQEEFQEDLGNDRTRRINCQPYY